MINGTRAYFAGLLLGLLGLAFAGLTTTRINQFDPFGRFHRYLNPESLFYPTASQVVALAKASATPDQTLVIVGGSSIVFGSGMGESELWTDALKAELGSAYGVVNLAFPSGSPMEHGAVAAQALLREGRDVIFVTPIFPTTIGIDGVQYPYVVWDADARGLQFPFAERDNLWDGQRLEMRIRARLDSVLHFTDLWNTIGYRCCMSVWHPLIPPGRLFVDSRASAGDPIPGEMPEAFKYMKGLDEVSQRGMMDEQSRWCTDSTARDNQIKTILHLTASSMPPELSTQSLLLVFHRSPYYTSQLDEAAMNCRRDVWRLIASSFDDQGYRTLLVGEDWTAEDFSDYVHPSGAGGRKLAHELADVIRGYHSAEKASQ